MKNLQAGKHRLVFTVPPDNWHDSFPIGNGVLGATLYQPEGCWEWVINHMDVVTSPYHTGITDTSVIPGQNREAVEEIKLKALKVHQDPKDPAYQDYNNFFGGYGGPRKYAGLFDPVCGRLRVCLDRNFSHFPVSSEQSLRLETGSVKIEEKYDRGKITCETFISRNANSLLVKVIRTGRCPAVRSIEILPAVSYPCELTVSDGTAVIKGKPVEGFSFVMAAKLIRGKGSFKAEREKLLFKVPENTDEVTLAITVVTSLDDDNPMEKVCRIFEEAGEKGYEKIKADHKNFWSGFWARSEIIIPDKFLEYLWYFSLYALNSTSGIGAKNPQGSSVYGLWYNAPSRWPNCWYEDVNIEEAFWPVYASNHLELSDSFVEGVKARLPAALKSARSRHGAKGASFGYFLYHCIGPWYCQYLWWHYRYSGDKAFLRETAYPIMKEVLAFFEDILVPEDDGTLSLYPSPASVILNCEKE